jgi:hypothetical protein
MARFNAALRALFGEEGLAPRSAERLATIVLYAALQRYDVRTLAALRRIDEPLARLLADLEALRTNRPIEGRTGATYRNDLAALTTALPNIREFRKDLTSLLADAHEQTSLRNALEAELGLTRSAAPLGASFGGGAPRFTGAPPAVQVAGDRLQAALVGTGPAPVVRPAPSAAHPSTRPVQLTEPRTGAQLMGELTAEVRAAALELIAAAGSRSKAIAHLLASGLDAECDQMVVAVLRAADQLWPGNRAQLAPGAGRPTLVTDSPQRAGFAAQETRTGTAAEWTGRLDPPIGGSDSIGIDGINLGRVVDSKHTEGTPQLPLDPAGNILLAAVDDRTLAGIERQLHELDRQLAYAEHNGLDGVTYKCSTPEQVRYYEQLFESVRPYAGASLGSRYPGRLRVVIAP